mmetsp:Transcript_20329/g.42624  ORF Transcript_20329/g.42624 Transcript_20329/m.42624 type:complete len:1867 (-) Transcript_20329:137-5737(-)|eukprot:CAMPEP_0172439164 /NCGR_PEP_ID=MMETSP1065-20121228/206_1 /TAXON_ID=265537 /ORGANISM="Amphiprora paludosa, Strain CCMP125" /LENGTH=1866 /DNA_ID=CAMNT_0013187807 /DNA_START=417 /DNA_END=6017 /DNA_ORIENTATION=-
MASSTRLALVEDRILTEVLGADPTNPDDPFRVAFGEIGITSPGDVMNLAMQDLDSLTMIGADGKSKIRITLAQKRRIIYLTPFWKSLGTARQDWSAITNADYEKFLSDYDPNAPTASVLTGNAAVGASIGTSMAAAMASSSTLAEKFVKNRGSLEDYSKFNDAKQWNPWHRNLIAVGRLHDIGEIFDDTFTPPTGDVDQENLWREKQKFAFTVFTSTLHEASAAQVLRNYSDPDNTSTYGNALRLYRELKATFMGGVQGKSHLDELEAKIDALKFDKSWTKGAVKFVTHLQHLLFDHHNLADSSLYSHEWYIRKANKALRANYQFQHYLSSLDTQNAAIARITGNPLAAPNYELHMASCRDFAVVYDAEKAEQKRNANNTNQRGVNWADQQEGGNDNNRGGQGRGGRGGGQNGGGGGQGGRGNGNGGRGGRGGGGGRGRGRGRNSQNDYVPDHVWNRMSREEQQAHMDARAAARRAQENNNANQAPAQQAPPAAAAPPAQPAQLPPGALLRNMLQGQQAPAAPAPDAANPAPGQDFAIGNATYRRITNTNITYKNLNTELVVPGALVDSGANGGLAGGDMRVLEVVPNSRVDITGVTDDILESLDLVQCAGVVDTVDEGPIVLIGSQYANRGVGRTIHSKSQMEHFGCKVHDSSARTGGKQCVITPEGYVIPLHVRNGLYFMDMHAPSDEELSSLPSVFITSDSAWDPSTIDDEYFHDALEGPLDDDPDVQERRDGRDSRVGDTGKVVVDNFHLVFEEEFFDALDVHKDLPEDGNWSFFNRVVEALAVMPQELKRRLPDMDILRPNFGWVSADRIKQTLEKTTQFYRAVKRYPFRKHFKSRFPAANVRRLAEWFAMDTVFFDIPAFDDGIAGHAGCTMIQLYCGLISEFLAAYAMASESELPDTLLEFIRDHGAMQGIRSDNAKSETSRAMKDIFRMYLIGDRQSEPHYQHQNPAERRIQDLKRTVNGIMDRVGCPADHWLLCLLYVVDLFNVLANSKGEIPKSQVTGEMTDVSPYLDYHFYQEIFVENPKGGEQLARWCGPTSKIGDSLTYWVLLNDTKKLVARSNIRPAKDPLFPNRRERSNPSDGDTTTPVEKPVVQSIQDYYEEPVHLPVFSPEELIGMTFLRDTEEGQTVRARVTRQIIDRDALNHQDLKFILSLGDGEMEELIAYNELCDAITEQKAHGAPAPGEPQGFKSILDYQGPLKAHDPRYKGSSWNVLLDFDDGTQSWEPVNVVGKDDPISLARYAQENDLLNKPGWKFLRKIARRLRFAQVAINAANRRSNPSQVRYKFGVRIPRNYKEAVFLDEQNGNTLWQDAIKLELKQLQSYRTFRDLGKGANPEEGFHKIGVQFVFDVKSDGRRKARLVARGDHTPEPEEAVYSSVAALRSLRIVTFIAELNKMDLMQGDIGNAYLESFTMEKVFFIAGPEFGPLEGHVMVIVKALYGLRSSGLRFHEKLGDTLRDMGFFPSYADGDVWMRENGTYYDYVVVWVDDLFVASTNPKKFFEQLQEKPYYYKLKGVGEPKYHLGADFFRDQDGTLCMGAQTYAKRLCDNFETLYGEMPKTAFSPMDHEDWPELDDSPLCTPDETAKYQSLIGACQWMISLCRFDVAHAIMSLSRFRHCPREGHVNRLKRVCGYVRKFPHGCIRFRTEIPKHEEVFGEEPKRYSWMETVYGSPEEELPDHMPPAKGKKVRTTTFEDANLMHDVVTGRSCTGILHMLNQTPGDWFTKRQNQVETATYGSEFMSARTAVEQIIDLRYTLRMFGVPLDGPAWLFGDNKSVVNSSTIPHSTLGKRWNALSYHRCREAVAAGFVRFEFIPGVENPADILTKALPHYKFRIFTDPLLFWKGDPGDAVPPGADQRGVTE